MEGPEGQVNGTQVKYESLALDTALGTLVVIMVYVAVKLSMDRVRQWRARVSILVVGAGPVGLTAALVAVRSGKVLNLTVLDERSRAVLLCRPQQIALDPRSVKFLLGLGVDFDNIEGCWHNDHFFTKIGVFQEHLLSILEQRKQTMDIRILLGTKFTEEYMRKIPQGEWPKIIVVADGSCGESSSLLGVCSEYIVESCNAYGANAALQRPDQRQVPTPEIRAHNLYFDLSAYGIDVNNAGKEASPQLGMRPGFHLKIYGTFRNRYIALACPSSDARVVRFLRYTPNSSIMKNIFHESFNAYKTDIEPRVSDLTLPHLQCSRRLFEVMLSHRRVTAAFIEGENIAVTLEGEAARVLNFDTGCGVNLGLRGLESSEEFIYKVATAVDQSDIIEALAAKIKHSKQVVEEFKFHGLAASVFE
ncbi:hypothetical protein XENTR_v10011465 [Xenopus tropicalis]|uniref:Uncharacterized protein LOC101733232 n=1 Tax=Xenopus tropicalis TaxID=8364 RepID=A0A8J1JFK0_XENTR|nr:uncharacterized protein LOC101733232 [Xenopus tropicalis]KAE8608326.1 hypothetical protein XENTR_v10011465 [Xenopus tropicalis]KAE8608327.1 hypothetical protein XENTR_v10011465 [Xenopus tropicalis]